MNLHPLSPPISSPPEPDLDSTAELPVLDIPGAAGPAAAVAAAEDTIEAVSYTHLTLPTILRV